MGYYSAYSRQYSNCPLSILMYSTIYFLVAASQRWEGVSAHFCPLSHRSEELLVIIKEGRKQEQMARCRHGTAPLSPRSNLCRQDSTDANGRRHGRGSAPSQMALLAVVDSILAVCTHVPPSPAPSLLTITPLPPLPSSPHLPLQS